MKAIVNATVISQGQALPDHALVFDQQIRAVCPTTAVASWPVTEVIDAQGLFAAPGLIDIHVHGCGGYDTMDASPEALNAMAACLARHGVTSFLPTTMAVPWPDIERALASLQKLVRGNRSSLGLGDTPLPVDLPTVEEAKVASSNPNAGAAYVVEECPHRDGAVLLQEASSSPVGARILGVHLEGPFLNQGFKGAHGVEWLKLPNFQLIANYIDVIRIITFAPELPGSGALLDKLAAYPHVVPAIGHSGASFEEAQLAVQQGIRHATHLFNAMSPMHHRQPGVVGAVLASGLSAEVIADNLHVHPGLYQLLLKTPGLDGLILVSDAMRAAGLDGGEYELGGQAVRVKEGAARLSDDTLAGSVLTLNKAVFNFQQATGCGLAEAIGLATRNPARLLGLERRIGDLATGMEADIVVLDEECNVFQTWIGGTKPSILNSLKRWDRHAR